MKNLETGVLILLRMRTCLSRESDLASVDLLAVFEYWQKREGMLATAVIRSSVLKTGPG